MEGHPECGDKPGEWYFQGELTEGAGNKGEAFVASELVSECEYMLFYCGILVYQLLAL